MTTSLESITKRLLSFKTFWMYHALSTCCINILAVAVSKDQASAAIIEAAVHAKDASKKIYPRKVGKGNSAPLWVPSLGDIGKADKFSKDVPWYFIDTSLKSILIKHIITCITFWPCELWLWVAAKLRSAWSRIILIHMLFLPSSMPSLETLVEEFVAMHAANGLHLRAMSTRDTSWILRCQVLHKCYTATLSGAHPTTVTSRSGQGKCPCFGWEKVRSRRIGWLFLVSKLGTSQIQLAKII